MPKPRAQFAPSALLTGPRPTEREVLVKQPSLAHNQRPLNEGGIAHG